MTSFFVYPNNKTLFRAKKNFWNSDRIKILASKMNKIPHSSDRTRAKTIFDDLDLKFTTPFEVTTECDLSLYNRSL